MASSATTSAPRDSDTRVGDAGREQAPGSADDADSQKATHPRRRGKPSEPEEAIEVQYNPTEFTLDKRRRSPRSRSPGSTAPLLQFVRGQAEKLTLDLFFDTTEHGMGAGADERHHQTDRIYQLVKIEPDAPRAADPDFVWNQFPELDRRPQATQRVRPPRRSRARARCVRRRDRRGHGSHRRRRPPLRASATSAIVPLRRGERQAEVHVVQPRGRAAARDAHRHAARVQDARRAARAAQPELARPHARPRRCSRARRSPASPHRYYERPREWRAIADPNGIDDPRRLRPARSSRAAASSEARHA